VIGGGNVAVDVALTALRCGATTVTMVCLEGRDEMPAHTWEVEGALGEGVTLMPSWGPHKILSKEGQVTGVELVNCMGVFDEKGHFSPVFGHRKETVASDQVVVAIGQASDLLFLEDDRRISVDKGLIVVDQETLQTEMAGVYAGGDVTEMPRGIIHAIAAGRKAASSMDESLGGDGDIDEVLFEQGAPNQCLGRDEGFATWTREEAPEIGLKWRKARFEEVALCLADDQALKEAKRCLQCDLRLCLEKKPSPPEKIWAFKRVNMVQIPESEGVYQLYDEERNIVAIKGASNMREALLGDMAEGRSAEWFDFQEDKMFSQRESELIQQYLRQHGEMPGGGDSDLDDLF